MKNYLVTLVVAATAVIHSQAADLATQLLGYWTLDAAQTTKIAEKANREIGSMKLMLMEKRMVYEFQKDQMIIHLGQGFSSPKPPPHSLHRQGGGRKNEISHSERWREGDEDQAR